MRLRLLALALLALIAVRSSPVLSQSPPPPDAARLAAAKSMMEAAGVSAQFDQMMPLLVGQISQSFAALRPDKAAEINETFVVVTQRFLERKGALIETVAAIYARALAEEDLKAIADFYTSPAGLRFKAVQPDIMRQSILAGQRWGEQLGREIDSEARKELKKRGIEL